MVSWSSRMLLAALLVALASDGFLFSKAGGVAVYSRRSILGLEQGVLTPPDQVLLEGATLRLNCTLTSYPGPLNASFVYFVYSTDPFPSKMVEVLSADTARLTVPSVTTDLDGYFSCRMNDSTVGGSGTQPIAMTRVYVGNLPRALTAADVTCVSDNLYNMTCEWCEAFEAGVTYTLEWTLQYGNFTFKEGTCTLQQGCSCAFGGADFIPFSLAPYALNITGYSRFGSSYSVIYVYTNASIVKPRPPQDFLVIPAGPESLASSWKHPVDLEPDILAVNYVLNCMSQWGDDNRSIAVGPLFAYTLTGLRPGTRYDLKLSCQPTEGGYMSDAVATEVATDEAAPAEGPPMSTGSFKAHKELMQVFWGDIPAKLHNGELVAFCVSWRPAPPAGGVTDDWSTCKNVAVDTYFCDLGLAEDRWWEVAVQGVTRVGRGPRSSLFIPPQDVIPPTPENITEAVVDDLSGISKITFTLEPMEGLEVANYTLFVCDKDYNYVCQSPMETFTIDGDTTRFVLETANRQAHYSMALNTRTASSGMPTTWLCLYYHGKLPGEVEFGFEEAQPERGLVITWDPVVCDPAVNTGKVTNYNVYIKARNETDFTLEAELGDNVTRYHFDDLEPYSEYHVGVEPVAIAGAGSMKTRSRTTEESSPDLPPQDVQVTNVTSDEIEVVWQPTPVPNGVVTSYTLQARSVGEPLTTWSAEVAASETRGRVSGLPGDVNYTVTVVATNGAGGSPQSPPVYAVTTVRAPAKLEEDKFSTTCNNDKSECNVSWVPPTPPNGPIVGYQIREVWRTEDGDVRDREERVPSAWASVAMDCSIVTSGELNFTVAGLTKADDGEALMAPWSDVTKLERQCPAENLTYVYIVVGVVAGLLILFVVGFVVYRVHKKATMKLKIKLPEGLDHRSVLEDDADHDPYKDIKHEWKNDNDNDSGHSTGSSKPPSTEGPAGSGSLPSPPPGDDTAGGRPGSDCHDVAGEGECWIEDTGPLPLTGSGIRPGGAGHPGGEGHSHSVAPRGGAVPPGDTQASAEVGSSSLSPYEQGHMPSGSTVGSGSGIASGSNISTYCAAKHSADSSADWSSSDPDRDQDSGQDYSPVKSSMGSVGPLPALTTSSDMLDNERTLEPELADLSSVTSRGDPYETGHELCRRCGNVHCATDSCFMTMTLNTNAPDIISAPAQSVV